MSEQPQRSQCKRYVNRDFHQHNQRLEETFKLSTQDKVHQQDRHEQNHDQFAHHPFVREEASREVHFPTVRFLHHLLHILHQLRGIRHFKEVHWYVFAVLTGSNALQVFRRHHLDQAAQRNMVHLPLGIGLCLHQGGTQHIVDAPLFAGNAHRQVLLIRTQRRHLVFLECRTQHPGQFVVRHVVQQQALPVHHQVHLVTEGDALGSLSRTEHDFLFQPLQFQRIGRLRAVFRMQLRHHLRFAGHEKLLEDCFRWRESQDRQRILLLHLCSQQLLQRTDAFGLFRLEVQFRFRGRQLTASVQNIVLHTHIGRMFLHLVVGQPHQRLHSSAVLVHMDVLVPLNAHHQLVLLYFGHTLLLQVIEEEHAQRQGGHRHQGTPLLVCEHPVHPLVVKAFQPIVFQAVVKTSRQETLATDANAIKQQIEYRQQHDTGDVRHQQPGSNGERLVHKDSPGNAAHENQRQEHRHGGKHRAEHGCNHLRCSGCTSPLQRIPLLPILRDVLCHDD